ncbi:formate hydrogenlyase subunit 3/multisubunit Na+/H+ antiporter MnhD subunit [Dietzia kunjamensis]|uniref:proton-conducting transporter transmembrane domain-containing protein n=1 Tax=Dietzia kunjamensis TaxID=322509 RepID=UPI000E713D70|nr:proton-conducting transporter membrane subunit [Dietzia kunjamensis]RKE65388.1 formate hydrogenlyase subunit 3/multisubunit Na+/H+ antiporter MnhD subunit [Dietzia kunjamensis]
MTAALWIAALVLPLVVAVALGLATAPPRPAIDTSVPAPDSPGSRLLLRIAPLTALPALALTVAPGATLEVPWLLLGTHLHVDGLARPLVLVSALLYAAALAAVAWAGFRGGRGLVAFLLVCHVGTTVVFTAGDTATFYLGYALLSFAAYGLVVNSRTAEALRAGRVYIVLTVISESAVLAALILVTAAGGTMVEDAPRAVADSGHTSLIVALLLVGFGVKAGTLPLHVWLPLAHPAAPPAASAVLSGAMVKAGLMGWLRFLPLGEVELPGWGLTLLILALAGAFLSVPAGELQDEPKVVLAYSTISQMGFLAALVGVALSSPGLAPAVIPAAVAYAVHHALAKGALFLGVAVWSHHAQGARRWVVAIGLGGAALAVAGAPFTSGAVGKYAAKNAVEGVQLAGVDLVDLLPLVATGSTLLLLRAGWLLVRREPEARPGPDAELAAWLLLVAAGIVVPWLVTDRWLPLTDVPGLDPVTLWDASWPILLGLAIAALALALRRVRLLPGWAARADDRTVPPGDVVVPEERLARAAGSAAASTIASGRALRERGVDGLRHLVPAAAAGRSYDSLEAGLSSRPGSGAVVVLFCLALITAGVLS